MSDGDLARLERDLEDLQIRLRVVENVDSPRQRELVGDLRALWAKVHDIDTSGASVTIVEIRQIKKDIETLNTAITGLVGSREEEARWSRRMILTSLFGAAVALAVTIVEFLLRRPPP